MNVPIFEDTFNFPVTVESVEVQRVKGTGHTEMDDTLIGIDLEACYNERGVPESPVDVLYVRDLEAGISAQSEEAIHPTDSSSVLVGQGEHQDQGQTSVVQQFTYSM
jgi:hypothetical protein